eukprot:CAMPEP_0113661264 /NCGR_PEP_ID=MMETSP0017_2-20120614/33334_1 /TAXON_ID=2856 /ORGANISM="Cylindrotheca closterium" /LENGTH=549 /DNA_ID=CAMNT_0000575941 /DNA_START=1 /DNA_END=1650 /DNA_ORIENTATION=+ /assembly_acc=CAM_ASM_000147
MGLNDMIQQGPIGRFFELEERKTNFYTEFRGAVATFLTMAYILAVNPAILADSGGPCVAADGNIFSPEYLACKDDIKKEYITATAISAMIGCLVMGIMANLPVALAPGMGLNAYFTFGVVGFHGTGKIGFEPADAVLIEGFIFLILALTGVRYFVAKLIPEPVRFATPAAIGAFLAHLGLQTAEGIGLVVGDIATAVTLGGCAEEDRVSLVALTDACFTNGGFDCVPGGTYTCDNTESSMTSATAWVGILGMLVTGILLAYKSHFAFVVGIGFVSIISWFRNTEITYFPDTEAGNAKFEYFQQVVSVEKMDKLLFPYSDDLKQVAVALITFLYVDFLDTSGTLLAIVSSMGYIDENGDFPKSKWAFSADAIATIVGSFFGLSPVTSYIESGAGVEAGAKTGLTAVICGFFFFLSIFFAPIIAAIPPWATGGSLIIVGALMSRSLVKVKWHIHSHAISAFITVMMMPLTYSIAYGLIGGMLSFAVMEGTFWFLSKLGIAPPSYEEPGAEGEEKVAAGDDDKEEAAAEAPEETAPAETPAENPTVTEEAEA